MGVSGGADSLCLLHVLLGMADQMMLRLHVAHLNHGLRGAEAEAEAKFVAQLADEWGIPATIGREDVQGYAAEHRLALEEGARQVRYAFLAATARQVGATRIAVAHHADDQAETVLMHFLRGSGAAGLRGMLPATPLTGDPGTDKAGLCLIRPLLGVTRAEIEAYCAANSLSWRADASNADTRHYRNRLRHELLPILAQYNPRINEVLARTAEVMAGDYEVLDAVAAEEFAELAMDVAPDVIAFEQDAFLASPVGLQRALLRKAVRRLRANLRDIHLEHIERAAQIAREGKNGDAATLAAGLELAVDYGILQIGPEGTLPRPMPFEIRPRVDRATPLAAPGKTRLPEGWRVEVTALERAKLPRGWAENPDPWTAYLDADAVGGELTLRPRQPGDRFRPHGLGGHSARINEFMINVKLPVGERATWPLLVGKTGIAWVCGYRIDEAAAVTPSTQRIWRVRFRR